MNDQERKWTREKDDSEKESISVITCDIEGRVETFNRENACLRIFPRQCCAGACENLAR
jgi:hypothetical protein